MSAETLGEVYSALEVLILIIMENTLWGDENVDQSWILLVLILIIMENTLWEEKMTVSERPKACLNPYYNGKYSMRVFDQQWPRAEEAVLILIIMENTLWALRLTS